MNKAMKKLLLVVFLFKNTIFCAPSHVLTFFVEPYPTESSGESKPEHNRGVYFSYFGYKTISDNNGQVSFPLKSQKPVFYFLVTNESIPVFMIYNTIAHWKVEQAAKYSFFSVERKYDTQTKLYFWNIQQIKLPADLEIPLNTIIVHADPENVFIPTNISVTHEGQQLVLPKIYIKSEVKLSLNALKFLENCQFFAPIDRTFKIDKGTQKVKA